MSENLLGPASVQYNDMLGTSAADRADHSVNHAGLHAAIGLDKDEWTIVAYSLYQGQRHVSIRVYAANRRELGIETFEQWVELAGEHGAIPVTEFVVDWKGTLGEFIDLAFKRFSVRLGLKGFKNADVEVEVKATGELSVAE